MPSTGLTVTNTFATQSGNVPASELDTNYAQLFNGFNTLVNEANYFVDTGSAGGLIVTVPAPLVATYVAGLWLLVKVAATNTAQGATVNINGLGNQNIVYASQTFGGSGGVLPGQLVAGTVVPLVYDGTNFQYMGPIFGSGTISSPAWTGFSVLPAVGLTWSITGRLASLRTSAAGATGTSNATNFGIALTSQPWLQGLATLQVVPTFLEDNTATLLSLSGVLTSSSIAFNPVAGNLGGLWTAAGTKGAPQGFAFVYPV